MQIIAIYSFDNIILPLFFLNQLTVNNIQPATIRHFAYRKMVIIIVDGSKIGALIYSHQTNQCMEFQTFRIFSCDLIETIRGEDSFSC